LLTEIVVETTSALDPEREHPRRLWLALARVLWLSMPFSQVSIGPAAGEPAPRARADDSRAAAGPLSTLDGSGAQLGQV